MLIRFQYGNVTYLAVRRIRDVEQVRTGTVTGTLLTIKVRRAVLIQFWDRCVQNQMWIRIHGSKVTPAQSYFYKCKSNSFGPDSVWDLHTFFTDPDPDFWYNTGPDPGKKHIC